MILTFRSQNDVISTEVGQLACSEYLTLARSMKQYVSHVILHFNPKQIINSESQRMMDVAF
jgi:hypothetical protein